MFGKYGGVALLWLKRRLVIVRSHPELARRQATIRAPVHDFVQLVFRASSVEVDVLRSDGLKLMCRIGNDEYMPGAVCLLLVVAVPAFLFHQAMDKKPVRIVLGAIRAWQDRFH